MSGNDSVFDALGPTARAIDLPGASVPPAPSERGGRRFVMVSFPAWTLFRRHRAGDPIESAGVREGVATDDRS